jgi:hypothetical protein
MMRTPLVHCPGCGHKLDAVTAPFDAAARPSPDDRTVCLNCGYVMKFDDELRLIDLTVDETIEAHRNPEIQQMLRAIRRIKQS